MLYQKFLIVLIYDITDIQTGLASLVKLGLINDFKNISNELLIMEYFKKNLGI